MRPFAVLAAVLALAALPALAQETAAPAPKREPVLPAITVSAVSLHHLTDRVAASGLVGPIEQVTVAPLIEGQPIEALLADVGDRVEAGQILARLSKTTLELQRSQLLASLASARATIAQAEAQLLESRSSADEASRTATRSAALREQGTVSQAANDQVQAAAVSATARVTVATQSLEAARAQLSLVEAQLANNDLQLSRTEVIAPVAGEIIARNAMLGGIASAAGQPMFTLIRDGALELRADVSEVDLLRLAPGQRATLRLTSSAEPLTGMVRLVEPSIDQATRLGRVRISFDDPSLVRDGMFAEATIILAERDTLSVPVTAVSSVAGKATVNVIDGDTARAQPVITGIRDAGFVEIVEGLAEGQLVVTKAGAFVRPGDRIRPMLDSETTN